MKKIFLSLFFIIIFVINAFALTGTYTSHNLFYCPGYGSFGLLEFQEYNAYQEIADQQITANKNAIAGMDLSLYYLKTQIDTLPEMETIWVLDIITSTELATYCETTQDYLKTSEEIDWTTDQGVTNIHAGNYTDTNTTYTGTVKEIVLTGTVFSLDAAIARDTELHAAATVTTTNGLSIAGQEISLQLSSASTHGALSDSSYNVFNSKQAALTFGIANTNAIKIDFASVVDDDYAKFTANGLEGRSYTEVKTDLGIDLSLYYLKTEMDSSGELAGIISDETGTGALVFATAPVIDFTTALASDHTYSGNIDSQPVGESVTFGMLLYFNWTDKEWKIAKADASTTMPGLRIALESKADGQTCKMLVEGYIRDDVDFEFTGAMVYVSAATAGLMTSTAPSTAGNQVQRVGVAKSADILFFSPSIDVGEI